MSYVPQNTSYVPQAQQQMQQQQHLDAYQKRLEAMQKIRDLAASPYADELSLKLPQICVVGDQSSGKSSVLSMITSLQFPERGGICTKAPIVVECQNRAEEEYWVRDPRTGRSEKVATKEQLCEKILEVQEVLLYGEQQAAGRASRTSASTSNALSVKPAMAKLNAANLAKMAQHAQPSLVSKTEIRVAAYGPDQLNIIVVDLPGLIHAGPGVRETQDLIREYTKPEQTLILLVSEANLDEQRIQALDLALEADPQQKRTMRLLTKFDCLENHDPETRAAAERLLKTGERGAAPSQAPDAKRVKANDGGKMPPPKAPVDADLMPHALVCRSKVVNNITGQQAMEYSEAVERRVLSSLPPQRCGVTALRERLPTLFARLVDVNLPQLQKQANAKLAEYAKELDELGAKPRDAAELIQEAQRRLLNATDSFKEEVSSLHREFNEDIEKTEKAITQEFVNANFKPNAFEPPLFQGKEAFEKCFREIIGWWRPVLEKFRHRADEKSRQAMHVLTSGETAFPKEFAAFLDQAWAHHCQEQVSAKFRKRLTDTLERELHFGTVNHYMETKYAGEVVLPDELVDEFLKSLKDSDFQGAPATPKRAPVHHTPDQVRANLKKALLRLRDAWASDFARKTLDEQQAVRIFATVKSAFAVEVKTFVDMVLKDTRDCVLKQRERWIEREMLLDEQIRAHAREDAATQKRRADLLVLVENLNSASQHLKGVM